MKGYKVFNPDWTCRGMQYEVGKTYEYDGDISICSAGFHFCQKAVDCFSYYAFSLANKVAEVEALGLIKVDGTKCVTNKLHIVREIPWTELLELVNTGNWNTGNCNTGDYNTGNRNTGDYNTGDYNAGNRNTGNRNTGNCNTGCYNTGNCNTGYYNTGCYNTGCYNTGDYNTGNRNTGNRNTGNCNTGDYNTGCWNIGNRNTGWFSTITPQISLFEKPTDLGEDEIYSIAGIVILNQNYKNNWWIPSSAMTDEEKAAHPEHETLGGYLKSIPFKDACALMWANLTTEERAEVQKIPNFDADIFERITGIRVGD